MQVVSLTCKPWVCVTSSRILQRGSHLRSEVITSRFSTLASSLHVLHPTFAAAIRSGNVDCYILFAMTSIVGVINLSPLEHTSPWASLHHILDRSCILNTLPFACTATPVSTGLFMVCVTPRPHNTIVRHLVFQSVLGAALTLIKGWPKNGCWNLSFPPILRWLPYKKKLIE